MFGMAHRGRLNVLSQVMGQAAPGDLPRVQGRLLRAGRGRRFRRRQVPSRRASSDRDFDGIKVHVSPTANPSHLEIVNPVVMGKARAKQDMSATVWDGDIDSALRALRRSCRC